METEREAASVAASASSNSSISLAGNGTGLYSGEEAFDGGSHRGGNSSNTGRHLFPGDLRGKREEELQVRVVIFLNCKTKISTLLVPVDTKESCLL